MAEDRTLTGDGSGEGELVGGRYETRRLIGAGGMGEVFEGYDTKLQRRVAMKRPPRESWPEGKPRQQLMEEARLQAQLDHPHIVAVQDVVDEGLGNPLWIVMKFVEGRSLKHMLEQRHRLEPRLAVEIGLQVASALATAHKRGVVHRDLKPSNVMIDENGWVYVLDFGIARLVEQTMYTLTGERTSGTLLYMAPEQHIGGRAAKDKPVDIFAFGAVMYEMITGEAAFAEAAEPALAKRERSFEPLREAAPECPPALAEVIERCLAPEQDERYGAFEDIEVALESAMPEAVVPGTTTSRNSSRGTSKATGGRSKGGKSKRKSKARKSPKSARSGGSSKQKPSAIVGSWKPIQEQEKKEPRYSEKRRVYIKLLFLTPLLFPLWLVWAYALWAIWVVLGGWISILRGKAVLIWCVVTDDHGRRWTLEENLGCLYFWFILMPPFQFINLLSLIWWPLIWASATYFGEEALARRVSSSTFSVWLPIRCSFHPSTEEPPELPKG